MPSEDTHHFLGWSLLKFDLQVVYLFQEVVIAPRSAVISAAQLTLLSSNRVVLHGYRSVGSDLPYLKLCVLVPQVRNLLGKLRNEVLGGLGVGVLRLIHNLLPIAKEKGRCQRRSIIPTQRCSERGDRAVSCESLFAPTPQSIYYQVKPGLPS